MTALIAWAIDPGTVAVVTIIAIALSVIAIATNGDRK